MGRRYRFQFYATVSERGQIFIPKTVQDYFGIKTRDKVAFVVQDDGDIVFRKKAKKGGLNEHKVTYP